MRKILNRTVSMLCSMALTLSLLPVSAAAEGTVTITGHNKLIQNVDSNVIIDLGDATVNGEKTVTISEYMDTVPESYVTDGLVLRLDGIETGDKADDGLWQNLAVTDEYVTLNAEGLPETSGDHTVGPNAFDDNYMHLNHSKIYLPSHIADVLNTGAYTVEYLIDEDGYNGKNETFAALLTVDEGADKFSIFSRGNNGHLEVKVAGNQSADRLKPLFDDGVGVPAAFVHEYNDTTKLNSWYANGKLTDSIAANAQSSGVVTPILGGRLNTDGNNTYTTNAKFYSVRIYDRVLTAAELSANATLDNSRFFGSNPAAPSISVGGTTLENDGSTQVTLTFVNGVATLPVNSATIGEQKVTVTVDGCAAQEVTLTTNTLMSAMENEIPDAVTVNVSSSASDHVISGAVAEQVYEALEGTQFDKCDGVVRVLGSESAGFKVLLMIDGKSSAAKAISVAVERAEATAQDTLKPFFQKVMYGTFDFAAKADVTAENIKAQVDALIGDETVTSAVAWSDVDKVWKLTLTQGEAAHTENLYINSDVSISFEDGEFMDYLKTELTGDNSAYIGNGGLFMGGTTDSTYDQVQLPVWYYGVDQMVIETELQLSAASSQSRWLAIGYGLKPDSDPNNIRGVTYNHMCLRQNAAATNGVEFAKWLGNWTTQTAAYKEALEPAKTYKATILYKNGRIYEYINDELILTYPGMSAEEFAGKMIFNFRQLNFDVKSIKVSSTLPDLPTEPAEPEMTANGYDTAVYEPVTGLKMSPTIVSTESTSAAEVAAADRRPATLVRTVNADGTITENGENLSPKAYKELLNKKVLAGFRVEDAAAAAAFSTSVTTDSVVDVNVISSSPEVLKAAKVGETAGVRGVLDFTSKMPEKDITVVHETCKANCRIALLDRKDADRVTVTYIQDHGVTVWVQCDADEVYDAILSGADGIVVSDSAAALDAIESFSEEDAVLTRKTVVVAHRGFHSNAPAPYTAVENTERSVANAVLFGADGAECDVDITSDKVVVLNHDSTTGRLMNENLSITGSTFDQLRALKFTAPYAKDTDRIPTLKELFDAAIDALPDDDDGLNHVIEIKGASYGITDYMRDDIFENGLEDRILFISFNNELIKELRQNIPEMTVGELTAQSSKTADNATNLAQISSILDPLNAWYNPNSGVVNDSLTRAARHRGLYVHPWTVNGKGEFETLYFEGYHGITTDRTDYPGDYLIGVRASMAADTAQIGVENAIAPTVTTDTRLTIGAELTGTPVLMNLNDGTTTAKLTGDGKVYAETAGTARFVLGTSYTLPQTKQTYTMYSEPLTVTFTGSSVNPPVETVISAESAALRAGTTKTEDGKGTFFLNLTDTSRIATVQITFETDSTDVDVIGQNGFVLLDTPKFSTVDGKCTGTAMLSYLEREDSSKLLTAEGETVIAQLAVQGDSPTLKITGVTISGWDEAGIVAFGTIAQGVNPNEATFTGKKIYDLNNDGAVNQLDITWAQMYYRATSSDSNWSTAAAADFNRDNVIDVADLVEIMLNFADVL